MLYCVIGEELILAGENCFYNGSHYTYGKVVM
jgi:hypothetical protein